MTTLRDPRTESIYGAVTEHTRHGLTEAERFTVDILPHIFEPAADAGERRGRYECAWCPLPRLSAAHGSPVIDEPYEGWSNRATWHAALVIHNEHAVYSATHEPARLARLRERPWSVQTWAEVLESAWASMVPASLRTATAKMPGRIDWTEIANDCAAEVME
jgi:hypothetical protein